MAEKKISEEGARFLKKSGAQVVISEDHFFHTIEPEFIASLKIHGQWLPIKGSELVTGKKIPLSLYHFMPLNKKFVLFAQADTELDQGKVEKAKKVGEVYFHREDFEIFQKYVTENEDKSASGLAARCRHQYMSAIVLFKELGLLLTDISEQANFQRGKELLERCYSIADDFVMTLGAIGDSWSIVNNAGFDDITPIDRAPAIGATASLMSLMTSIGNPTEIFLCAMLADLGLLELPPSALKPVMEGLFDDLKGETFDLYQKHPLYSVNRVLSRKLPLDEKTKNIILATHEKVNGKGFPSRLEKDRVPLESQIIHLAELVDKALKIQEGKQRVDPAQARRQTLEDIRQQGFFSIDLMLKISKELP
jgi:response regulator RpfG family c-di-GMP phosphodiesterase